MGVYSRIPTAELEALLDKASAAYTNRLLGQTPKVIVNFNGERIDFSETTPEKIKAMVNEIEAELAARQCGRPAGNRAIFIF